MMLSLSMSEKKKKRFNNLQYRPPRLVRYSFISKFKLREKTPVFNNKNWVIIIWSNIKTQRFHCTLSILLPTSIFMMSFFVEYISISLSHSSNSLCCLYHKLKGKQQDFLECYHGQSHPRL